MDTNINSFVLCSNCIKSKYIKSYIHQVSLNSNCKCTICGENGTDIAINSQILEMIADNVRYYYPMYKYFEKPILLYAPFMVNLKALFMESNYIFDGILNEDNAAMVRKLLNEKTTLNNELVWNIAYKGDNKHLETLNYYEHMGKPIKEAKATLVYDIEKDLETKNSYEIYNKYLEVFKKIKDQFPNCSLKGSTLYRARIGCNKKKAVVDDWNKELIFPYIQDEMHSPPPLKATSGRFNRQGYAFLYAASDESTAISEIKPDVGHICSVATLGCNEDKAFLDLRMDTIDKIILESDLILKNIVESMARLFSEPIPKEENCKYLVTQFMSDVFRELEFAGIIYDSSLTTGYNITAFYPRNFYIEDNSEKLFKVSKVRYSYEHLDDERKKYKHFDFIDDNDDEKYGL